MTTEQKLDFLLAVRGQFEELVPWSEIDPTETDEPELEALSPEQVEAAFERVYTAIKKPNRPIGDL